MRCPLLWQHLKGQRGISTSLRGTFPFESCAGCPCSFLTQEVRGQRSPQLAPWFIWPGPSWLQVKAASWGWSQVEDLDRIEPESAEKSVGESLFCDGNCWHNWAEAAVENSDALREGFTPYGKWRGSTDSRDGNLLLSFLQSCKAAAGKRAMAPKILVENATPLHMLPGPLVPPPGKQKGAQKSK